ncbi:MAG: hypothetical protein AAGU21_04540 [Solidesulfovibrio sp.]|uniref:hypothetical protein n=1 Tax=Solidesulfovibrio sp. TaxID=2910990 RepID=UPI002B1ED212|nr:hypothetical protein [Solidesulfovibrio sp.]MEA4858206.1 hypothetical protein [Solidesulfovibrio sp.]
MDLGRAAGAVGDGPLCPAADAPEKTARRTPSPGPPTPCDTFGQTTGPPMTCDTFGQTLGRQPT